MAGFSRKRQKATGYKVKRTVVRNNTTNRKRRMYNLGLHPEFAERVPEDTRFSIEFTEDGILYRVIKSDETAPVNPDWAI